MRLTETRLRSLIRDILLEGVRENVAALEIVLGDDEEAIATLQTLPPKWVNWLSDRYLRKKYPVHDTLPDVLPLVASFASKDAAISQKYGSNEQFRDAVDLSFPPATRKWQNPSNVTTMSAADLAQLLALSSREKQRVEVDRRSEAWKQDKIGQFGPWALYFPTTRENSINIAGADPVTLKGYTTWCTARTDVSNLFYNYAGQGVMLFYAIDESKPPTDPKGRISLGFARGELNTSGVYGGYTVDAANNGLMRPDLKRIFGGHLGPILSAAESVVKSHGGSHPAMADIKAAAADPVKFTKMLRGLSDDEAAHLAAEIMRHKPTAEVIEAAASHKSAGVRRLAAAKCESPDMLARLAADPKADVQAAVASNKNTPISALEKLSVSKSVTVRGEVAFNESTSPSVLEQLASDPDVHVRELVAQKRNTPPSVLEQLASDSDGKVRYHVAKNPNTLPSALEKLASDPDGHIQYSVAGNSSTSSSVLEKLAGHPDRGIQWLVALNPSTSSSVLEKLAGHPDGSVRWRVAQNPGISPYLLEKLAGDPDKYVRGCVASNYNASLSLLQKLAGDPDEYIRGGVAQNRNTPLSVLQKLAGDPDKDVRGGVADNSSTPSSVLEKLARDRASRVRHSVAMNDNTPTSVLERLSQDRVGIVRSTAARALAKRSQVRESRRLALKIIAELKRR